MEYVSGIQALNLTCNLKTAGDWHMSCMDWNNLYKLNSEDSIFKEYGIEKEKDIPNHPQKENVANHIRACLDMLFVGDFSNLQGMKENFICNDNYNQIIFEKIYMLNKNDNWEKIDDFVYKEYGKEWRLWKIGRLNIKK